MHSIDADISYDFGASMFLESGFDVEYCGWETW